jgi:type I site-specific restriction endonuclease
MKVLNFPTYDLTVRDEGDRSLIFDPLRKRYVTLTPEEWVRQHVIRYLMDGKGFPAGLLSVEGTITLFRMTKRYDIAAFDRQGHPLLVVECKSYDVALNEAVVDQVIRYNITLKAPYLLITNGIIHIALEKDAQGYRQIREVPEFTGISV